MRRKILPFILGGALSIAAVAPAAAQTDCTITSDSRGGAVALASLIGAAVNAADLVDATVCDVNVLNNSLNNLLQNADIEILNNVLNNSANNILRDANIEVVSLEDNVIIVDANVLSAPLEITLVNA